MSSQRRSAQNTASTTNTFNSINFSSNSSVSEITKSSKGSKSLRSSPRSKLSKASNEINVEEKNNVNHNSLLISPRSFESDLESIYKMRDLSKRCCENVKVLQYVNDMSQNVKLLVDAYNNDVDHYKNLNPFAANDIYSAGQVLLDDIDDVFMKGNLREKMTLAFHNFPMHGGCKILLWMVKNRNKKFRLKGLNNLEEKMYKLSGLPIDELYQFSNETDDDYLPCAFATTFQNPTLLSQHAPNFPISIPMRKKSKASNTIPNSFKIKRKELYPSLSEREIKFINYHHNKKLETDVNQNNREYEIPWMTGLMYWRVLPDNIYNRIANKFENIVVSGLSGHTGFVCMITQLFHGYNVELSILAAVAYMCNPPDHSPFEILMSAIPYGFRYYANQSAFQVIEYLLHKYK